VRLRGGGLFGHLVGAMPDEEASGRKAARREERREI